MLASDAPSSLIMSEALSLALSMVMSESPPVMLLSVIVTVSFPSKIASFNTATSSSAMVSPAEMVTVPESAA